MGSLVVVFATLVFVASLCIHLWSLASTRGVPPSALVWAVHLSAMISFALMLYRIRRDYDRTSASVIRDGIALGGEGGRAVLTRAIGGASTRDVALVAAAFIYMAANFTFVLSQTFDGEAKPLTPGGYGVVEGGRVIRQITYDEYLRRQRLDVRGFSGHAIFFSLLPLLYFRSLRPAVAERS